MRWTAIIRGRMIVISEQTDVSEVHTASIMGDGGSTHSWNVGLLQRDYAALYLEGSRLYTCRRENLKSHFVIFIIFIVQRQKHYGRFDEIPNQRQTCYKFSQRKYWFGSILKEKDHCRNWSKSRCVCAQLWIKIVSRLELTRNNDFQDIN
jgi:hypothetical protein